MQDATKRWLTEDEQLLVCTLDARTEGRPHTASAYLDVEDAILLLKAIDRLCADRDKVQCAKPDATTCAKQWEADHQRAALEQHGLAGEFPYGPDAIEHVAEALVEARASLDKQQEVIGKLRRAMGDANAAVWGACYGKGISAEYTRSIDEKCRAALDGYFAKEAAAAARAGEGK